MNEESWAPGKQFATERGACGKRRYESVRSAREAHKYAGWRVRTYWCDECRGWHATNTEKVEVNRRARGWGKQAEDGEWGRRGGSRRD